MTTKAALKPTTCWCIVSKSGKLIEAHARGSEGDIEVYRATHYPKASLQRIMLADAEEHNCNFLWPFAEESLEQAVYELANAKTEEYRQEMWNKIRELAAASPALSKATDL